MTRMPKLVSLTLAAAIAVPGLAIAQDMTATAELDLNVRAGPGPTYPVVTVIGAADTVMVHGCNDPVTWCDVTYGEVRGWAYAEYLIYQTAPIPQAPTPPPPVAFEPQVYWETYYQDQPFYAQRDQWIGGGAGAAGGALAGALVFGPVGAAVGAVAGAIVGAVTGEALTPPEPVVTYVNQQQPQPIYLEGAVVVGAGVPEVVTLQPIPDYEYQYAYINGQWVLVEPTSRQIVYIFR